MTLLYQIIIIIIIILSLLAFVVVNFASSETDFAKSRNIEEDMGENRDLWREWMDGIVAVLIKKADIDKLDDRA